MGSFAKGCVLALAAVVLTASLADARLRRRGRLRATVYYDAQGMTYYENRGRTSLYPREQSAEPVPAPNQVEGQVGGAGTIDFRAPQDAQIWVNGRLVERTGDQYLYQYPPLRTGQRQNYEIRARWTENGRVVNQTRNVTVESGGRINVDFTRPAPK